MSRSAATLQQKISVASVTVAYNGAAVLSGHLESLKRQSCQIDEIVVVDNASTDQTRNLLARRYPRVKQLSLPCNRGIAGGLAAGVAYAALERQHDWIWIFDQDSLPAPDALEQLLAAIHRLKDEAQDIAIVAPICINQATGMKYPGLRWNRHGFSPHSCDQSEPVSFVDMVISSGSLIRREGIEEAGLPREDFFMDFVDYEHCLRLRRQGFRIAIVRDSTLDHAIGEPTTVKIFGRRKFWADHPPWREYYMARNEIFTIQQYRKDSIARAFVLFRIAHHACGILLFGKSKLECCRMIWRGIVDGYRQRLGIRFLSGTEEHPPAVSKGTLGGLVKGGASH